jgi:ferredoxin
VLAYDKDPLTGIVRHLDDQCIGCQYCVFKCPYEVPKYSERRGIVRKCDLCSSRLVAGEAPACAQACPGEAIRITLVDTAAVAAEFRNRAGRENLFLPDSPAPDYTLPTTRYTGAPPMPDSLRAAGRETLRPEPAHSPLVFMLVLSQLAVGQFLGEALVGAMLAAPQTALARPVQMTVGLAAALLAAFAGALHLGRPLGAWRAFLGLRKSWLSREIVVFGAWLAVATLDTAMAWFPQIAAAGFRLELELANVVTGLLGVFCSAMVYHDTRREFWRLPATGGKFFGTTLLLGAAGT